MNENLQKCRKVPLVFWGMGGKLTFERLVDIVDKHEEKYNSLPLYIELPQELYDRYIEIISVFLTLNMPKKLFFYGSGKPMEIKVKD